MLNFKQFNSISFFLKMEPLLQMFIKNTLKQQNLIDFYI